MCCQGKRHFAAKQGDHFSTAQASITSFEQLFQHSTTLKFQKFSITTSLKTLLVSLNLIFDLYHQQREKSGLTFPTDYPFIAHN